MNILVFNQYVDDRPSAIYSYWSSNSKISTYFPNDDHKQVVYSCDENVFSVISENSISMHLFYQYGEDSSIIIEEFTENFLYGENDIGLILDLNHEALLKLGIFQFLLMKNSLTHVVSRLNLDEDIIVTKLQPGLYIIKY